MAQVDSAPEAFSPRPLEISPRFLEPPGWWGGVDSFRERVSVGKIFVARWLPVFLAAPGDSEAVHVHDGARSLVCQAGDRLSTPYKGAWKVSLWV